MTFAYIDYSDGVFSMREISPSNVQSWKNQGTPVVEVPDDVWKAYKEFCGQARSWNDFLSGVDNVNQGYQND